MLSGCPFSRGAVFLLIFLSYYYNLGLFKYFAITITEGPVIQINCCLRNIVCRYSFKGISFTELFAPKHSTH